MKNIITPFLCALAVSLACSNVYAAAPVWDTGAGVGIQVGSGTWDFNTTSNWTLNGGGTRVNWTANADLANFQLQGIAGTVTINNTNGQVGTGGLTFSGTTGSTSNVWTLGADTSTGIQLGAGGLTNQISDGLLVVNAPLALTASQTWTSTKLGQIQQTAGVRANGAISTISGTTNLNFDGLGLSSPVKTANTDNRVIFELSGNNTFTGTTTVTGGAALRLNYVTNSGSKLDDSSALIFKGGTIILNGGSNVTETVASTTIDSGANTISAGSSNGGGGIINTIALGALTHNISGTLEVTSAVTGIAKTTTANTNGIIGGWATLGGNRFATGSTDGVTSTNIGNTAGSTNTTYSTWGATTNTVINAAVSGSGDKTTNTLRVASGGSLTLSSGTLTIASGGIIGDSGGPISGGNLTSGTTALYVHTPSALTISSAIVNGASSVALVKAGSNTLTISGLNTYTGGTYVNSGTLLVSGSAVLSGPVTEAGGATLSIGSGAGNGGTLAPGTLATPGTISLGGNLSLNDGATMNFRLGTSFDRVSLTNSFATLTGATSASGITLNLSNAGGLAAQTYTLIEWQPGTTLTSFDLADFSVAVTGGFTGNLQMGTNSLNYVVTAVPEPSTVALVLASGMLTVGVVRRRARKTAGKMIAA